MHQYPTPAEMTYRLSDSGGDRIRVTVDLDAKTITISEGLTVFDLRHKADPNRSLSDLIRTLEACSDMLRDPVGIVLASEPTDSDTNLPF